MTARLERERKTWKTNGLNAEKRVTDAEILAEKAKAKYEATAEQYDRVRTGDKQAGKFGFKGPKSAAQAEEDLLRKCQHSDSEYLTKVQAAQTAKQELVSSLRPAAVRALTDLITECDSALSLQMARLGKLTLTSSFIFILTPRQHHAANSLLLEMGSVSAHYQISPNNSRACER